MAQSACPSSSMVLRPFKIRFRAKMGRGRGEVGREEKEGGREVGGRERGGRKRGEVGGREVGGRGREGRGRGGVVGRGGKEKMKKETRESLLYTIILYIIFIKNPNLYLFMKIMTTAAVKNDICVCIILKD